MNKLKKTNQGFIGILMLVIGVAIIVFIIVRTDLFSGKKGEKNAIEQGHDSIEKANDVKDLLERNDAQMLGQ